MPLENNSRADIVRIGITSSGDIAKVTNDQKVNIQSVSATVNTDVSSIATSETVAVDNLELNESATVDNLSFTVKTSVQKAIITSSGQSSGEHAALHGLDYAHSGHTGFASQEALNQKQTKFTLGPTLKWATKTELDTKFSVSDIVIDY